MRLPVAAVRRPAVRLRKDHRTGPRSDRRWRTRPRCTPRNTPQRSTITFRSTRITGTPHSFEITGDLTIKGRTRPATVHGKGTETGCCVAGRSSRSPPGHQAVHRVLGRVAAGERVRMEFEVARLEPADGPG
nr:YceI family protein [Streptomyces regalis]